MEASEFWTIIKKQLKELGRNQEWLADRIGIPLQTLRNRISKERLPDIDEAMRMFRVLGLDADEIFWSRTNRKTGEDRLMIPVLDQVLSAGHGQFVSDTDTITDYVTISPELAEERDHLFALKVRGDSMEPTLHDDDRIVCDDLGYDGEDGIFAIQYKGMGFVKRLQRSLEGIRIISDNKNYEPMSVKESDEDFRVIGRVRYVLHRLY